jgi:hypothetical protein
MELRTTKKSLLELLMSILKNVGVVVCCGMIVIAFSACKKEGPAERAGRNIDETVEKAGKKIDESAAKAGKKLEEAGKKIRETTK